MSKFVLTAQLQLQAPNNVSQVVGQIQKQLSGVTVNVNAVGTAKANKQVQQLSSSLNVASQNANKLGKNFGTAIRRFSASAIAYKAVSLFTSGLSNAIKESIAFERELIKIAQVTGNTTKQLQFLTRSVSDLSTQLGVSSSSLLGVSRILSQAGLSARQTEIALNTLAKTQLAPTFDDISQTAEGAIAIFNQFQKGAAALEAQLGAINAVAGQFAVESGDLISVVRRTGGVFKAAGGELNELIALFTSVRSTTRESAESIATGLRTIFTRIQRPRTIEFLKKYGVELTDLEGKFVGPYEAVRRLSQALSGLEQGDITFVQIAEELGGFRQIGKVIPLLQQFEVAQRALNVAQSGSGSLAKDAATAQQALAVQVTKVKEEFLELIRGVTATPTFQIMAKTALTLASALIKVADALKPILPIMTAMAAVKFTQSIGGFLGGLAGGIKGAKGFHAGGVVHKFARGGMVPGSGNSDTVPAMLTPGEFVIKKSSVNKLGASNLEAMNNNKYAKGGIVVNPDQIGGFFLKPAQGRDRDVGISGSGQITNLDVLKKLGYSTPSRGTDEQFFFGSSGKDKAKMLGRSKANTFLENMPKDVSKAKAYIAEKRKSTVKNDQTAIQNFDRDYAASKSKVSELKNTGAARSIPISGAIGAFYPGASGSVNAAVRDLVDTETSAALKSATESAAIAVNKTLDNVRPEFDLNDQMLKDASNRISKDGNALATTSGFIFEGIIDAITGAKLQGDQSRWDFKGDLATKKEGLAKMFASDSSAFSGMLKADAKRSNTTKSIESITRKIINDINANDQAGYSFKKFASGGAATGSDTVPAMLTPGEFVVNKKASKNIGYGNLSRMNKVGKYARGGVVKGGVQHFAGGGGSGSSGGGVMGMDAVTGGLFAVSTALGMLTPTIDENSSAMARMAAGGMEAVASITNLALSISAVSTMMKSEMIGSMVKSFKGFRQGLKMATKPMGAFGGNLRPTSNAQAMGMSASKKMSDFGATKVGKGLKTLGKPVQFIGKSFMNVGKGLGGLLKSIPGVTGLLGGLSTGLSAAVAGLTAFAGPILAIAAAGAVIGGVIKGFRDLENRLNKAVEKGDVGEAQNLAVSKAAEGSFGGIVGGLASLAGAEEGLVNFAAALGGQSVAAIKSDIASRIQSAKTAKALAEAQKVSAEAMEDLKNGTINAAEALSRVAVKTQEARKNQELAGKAIEANAAGKGGMARDIFTLGGLLGESSGQRNARIDEENKKRSQDAMKQREEAFGIESKMAMTTARSVFASGGSMGDVKANLKTTPESLKQEAIDKRKQAAAALKSGDAETAEIFEAEAKQLSDQANQLEKSLLNLQKEVEKQQKYMAAMNLGLNSAQGAAGAFSNAMSNYTAAQEAGNVSVMRNFETLKAGITNAAGGMNPKVFQSALKETSDVLASFGASDAQLKKFETNMSAINKAQANAEAGLNTFQAKLRADAKKGVGGMTGEAKFDELFNTIVKGSNLGPEMEKQLKDMLGGIDIDYNKIAAGDFSQIDEVFEKLGVETLAQAEAIVKAEQEYQMAIVNAAKNRAAAEDAYIAASRQRLDYEKEAREISASAGGPAFTAQQQRQMAVDRFNVGAEGGPALRGASANDIVAQQESLKARQAAIQNTRVQAARGDEKAKADLAGESGIKLSQEESNLNKQNQELYNTTKTLIDIKRKEIDIIKAKNKLQQDSFDALMSGDTEGFMDAQATQGAVNAIAAGGPLGDFDADTLQQAFNEIKRQADAGVTEIGGQQIQGAGGLLQRASEATLQARGLDPAQAALASQQVLGSPAEQAANNEIQALASTLTGFGDMAMDSAQAQKLAADAQREAAVAMKLAATQMAEHNSSRTLSKGGIVYASKGKLINFVPKGTDTVPAMLTPGEFVVNRKAVQRGNNLSMLQAMNRGSQPSAAAPAAMSRGGVVYRHQGSTSPESASSGGSMGFDSSAMTQFAGALEKFNDTIMKSIETLQNTKFTIKLDPTTVNINLTGSSFLQSMTEGLKSELFGMISKKFSNLKVGMDGRVTESASEVT